METKNCVGHLRPYLFIEGIAIRHQVCHMTYHLVLKDDKYKMNISISYQQKRLHNREQRHRFVKHHLRKFGQIIQEKNENN